jgi:hypothetical protein
MADRRAFLTAVASGSVALSLATPESAVAQVTPAPLTPSSPAATASAKLPSFGAAATAATMREIDPSLTQDQIDAIARGIDANRDAAKALNPKKKRLKNADAPAVTFAIADGVS